MATRHSFLSTTGLIRAPSNASSIVSLYPASSPPVDAESSTQKKTKNLKSKNIKNLTLPPTETPNLKRRAHAGVIPLGPVFIVGMAVVLSLFYIGALSFAFIGAEDEAVFKDMLNDLARNDPGILLIGDNVDVDVDEPAITVRWSLVACGQTYLLPGSEGTHGSSLCGIPNVPLNVYVDGDEKPTWSYDPDKIPSSSAGFSRLSVQNLYQFDSDHVLDVHEARLYPFDTYHLTTNLRAEVANTSTPTSIVRLVTLSDTASFIVHSFDTASTVLPSSSSSMSDSDAASSTELPSRDLDMTIKRPGEARFFALMLFGISWMMAHATVGYVALAWKSTSSSRVAYYLVLSVITMMVIPQLRNTMPDAPGYDGVLIDQIGFFSQMVMAGIATITLLCTLAKRELASISEDNEQPTQSTAASTPGPMKALKGPSASIDFRHMRSLSKNFLTKLDRAPPTPIPESPLNPFEPEAPPVQRSGGSYQAGRRGQRNGFPSQVEFSKWV
ncbi:hypothetical protein BDY19DRAFT_960057 [Irpex rosettiformis]|uniref:Uncharacterized protein n=1 Tax=Irpex rosettiformis TaxID=378272 RepID=A0ACB8TWL5_9APHY|nr:hypothetical protein BDY19DRAFT_960057 [Irpex rosettiformis]